MRQASTSRSEYAESPTARFEVSICEKCCGRMGACLEAGDWGWRSDWDDEQVSTGLRQSLRKCREKMDLFQRFAWLADGTEQ